MTDQLTPSFRKYPVRCVGCASFLGHKCTLFHNLCMSNTTDNVDVGNILTQVGIETDCCRSHVLSARSNIMERLRVPRINRIVDSGRSEFTQELEVALVVYTA